MRGFTLAELMIVLFLLGLLLGLPLALIERMDPGAKGLESSIASYIRASRDRARTTGDYVVVEPPTTDAGEFTRLIWRPVLEASFEAEMNARHGVEELGPATTGVAVGRFGAALDLRGGGGARVAGRDGRFEFPEGLVLELHFRSEQGDSGLLLDWPNLLRIEYRNNASLRCRLNVGHHDAFAVVQIGTESGVALPGRWHHLKLRAADKRFSLWVDGLPVASAEYDGNPAVPGDVPTLGDPQSDFIGMLDEFVVRARYREQGPSLQDGSVVGLDPPGALRFDRDGLLDWVVHPGPVAITIYEFDEVIGGFKVGRFAEEDHQ